ncbi:hypothetical protein [Aquimarina sp. AU119]|uniref:hypothetical protein n=1 Tax=Aquimarina sp. AU119 TaxID=2108528 RepID=UPI000D69CB2B|nr:hypothetical protein [Aquimarina sp. AU119]
MDNNHITYANELGEFLAPFLKLLRATGFFEAYVFMPLMTILSIVIFRKLRQTLKSNGTFNMAYHARFKILLLSIYYSLCFMLTNVTAVAFKTLIIEEMDYETPVWFMHLVGPLHFYISSVVLAYLWLIIRNQNHLIDRLLCLYIQFGLFGGHYTGIHRLLNEPFELLDVTTGMSGIFFLFWFGILNADIAYRFFRKKIQTNINLQEV